jgi:uncharacterized metal-binding protein YceD (DUF177 family)
MGFVLDLRQLSDGRSRWVEAVKPSQLELEWPGLEFGPSIQVQLDVGRTGNDLDLALVFTGDRRGECDRCLKPFEEAFRGSIRAIARRAGPDHELAGQDGVIFHDGLTLDLTVEVREAVLVDIPIQQLCTADCRGLCPSCGIDLNTGSCDCSRDAIDPRWEALRKARP